MTFKDEAFVFCLDECEASGNAGEDGTHAASDDLLKSFDEREFLLVKPGVFGHSEHDVGRMPFL